jgi:hypothetical protein
MGGFLFKQAYPAKNCKEERFYELHNRFGRGVELRYNASSENLSSVFQFTGHFSDWVSFSFSSSALHEFS